MATAADAPGGSHSRAAKLAVLVAALGYFVDIYDLLLFSIIRIPSLKDLGLTGDALTATGLDLLSLQMIGMLVGGIVAGVIGDRRGRISVLFGSIVLYSLANIANGFVTTIPQYSVARFVAGVGLAGELGAGITLVSELMKRETRGYGTTIVATVGICGALVAATVADLWSWRIAYFVGGGLGLSLLALRVGVLDSPMFKAAHRSGVARGNFFALFTRGDRLRRYLAIILIGLPIWYVVGILITFSPELGRALGLASTPPQPGRAVFFCYMGLVLGDLASGLLSQLFKTRKKVIAGFHVLTALSIAIYFLIGGQSLAVFYACCFLLGLATGYWAVFVTIASEQFGTNLRATVTTTVPNFVRGAVVPITWGFDLLRVRTGAVPAALVVGGLTLIAAVAALRALDETYGRDLDFVER